ncbi:MAG: SDR family oxidoreductase, partial [Gammaproteobacteria bacterium]|nr:SDR family oxidoreductase [Gammaproteobacteria bacterium]
LGKACAHALAAEGVDVYINARSESALRQSAEEIAASTGAAVSPVVGDVTTERGRADLLTVCPEPDILINNAGGPPPGDFRDWRRDDWIRAIDANMLAPIEFIRATVDGMSERRFGRILNITSSAVKAPIRELGLSNGARSGLTGFVAGLARETVCHNVTINNLLPGPFATDRLRDTVAASAKREGCSADEMHARRLAGHPARRYGDPEEFGRLCAYLCSIHAGYIAGQNLLIDGGAYPGTF